MESSTSSGPSSSSAPQSHPGPSTYPSHSGQGSESSPAASDDTSLGVRLLVPGREAGTIIGRGGEYIKRLREQTRCGVNVSDDPHAPERIVSITGSLAGAIQALAMIATRLEEDPQNQQANQLQGGDRRRDAAAGGATICVIVPSSQCGALIGRGGAQIKQIRDTSGASIQVASEPLPYSSERAVTVSGSAGTVSVCLEAVCRILAANPAKGNMQPYKPRNTGRASSSGMGGFDSFGAGFGAGSFSPPSHHYPPRFDSPRAMSPPFVASRAGGFGEGSRDEEAEEVRELRIANDLVGGVIGRGGSNINEIRRITGAAITISEIKNDHSNSHDRSRDRMVEIRGTSRAVREAIYHIEQQIHLARNRGRVYASRDVPMRDMA